MKKLKVLLVVMAMVLAMASLASAAGVDVIAAPTGFFVPTDAQKFDAPYYRWWDEDWGWTHNPLAGASGATSATLNISSFDVDLPGEVDDIYAWDDGVLTYVGSLTGSGSAWSFNTFVLPASFYNDIESGLIVWMDIDATHTEDTWAVTLAKSVVEFDGGTLPDPNPSVPEPASMLLLGLGLAGLAGLKKKLS